MTTDEQVRRALAHARAWAKIEDGHDELAALAAADGKTDIQEVAQRSAGWAHVCATRWECKAHRLAQGEEEHDEAHHDGGPPPAGGVQDGGGAG